MKPMIRERRMEKHMTQTELANRLGIKQQQLSRYEKGVSKPSLEVLFSLENILECRLNDLYVKE
jgi:transcriptional regulator with XRE-family HTH domain